MALFGLILVGVVAFAGLSANNSAVVRERQLVENALDQSVVRTLDEQKAIAWWDDAVLNAQARPLDLDWIDANIGLYFYETYGHDEIYLVDGQNRPIYGTVDGVVQEEPAAAYARHADVLMVTGPVTKNMREALEPTGIDVGYVPTPLNLFMNTLFHNHAEMEVAEPQAKVGDSVTFRALADCVAVMSACPQDMVPVNAHGCTPQPVGYCVLD